jgi:hypothetical protein
MDKLFGALRALAVLAGLWAVLFIIGLVGGVIPFDADDGDTAATTADAGAADGGGLHDAGDAAAAETGTVIHPSPPTLVDTVERYAACSATAFASLSAAQALGDPRPEVLVACGRTVQLVAIEAELREGHADLSPMLAGRFEAAEPPTGSSIAPARPRAADVDGDSLPDLVLPFSKRWLR